MIYKDGKQLRDFVRAHDVARAFRLAIEKEAAPHHILNIGRSGIVGTRRALRKSRCLEEGAEK